MKPEPQAGEARSALAAAWARLPDSLRLPTQFLGRHYAGCGATIGAMPKCDFACAGCYLGEDSNRAKPLPLEAVFGQLRLLREWLGPAGNVQITDGEVSLRSESELCAIIRHARGLGLVPMLMSHGETFRRKPGLLERLMTGAGLTEVSIHVDTTQRGRRDRFALARSESDLDPLREEFADMIRAARRRTGLRLEAASTLTVTRENLEGVPGVVRWFLANADAFKMVSFQPLADVGRTDKLLRGVHPDELWGRIAAGTGDPALRRGEGYLGHPGCTRFVQGIVPRNRTAGSPTLVPLYRSDDPQEMRLLSGLLDRVGGESFRLDDTAARLRRVLRFARRHGGFALTQLLPHVVRLWRRAGTFRVNYLCIVSHHFMDASELAAPEGRERVDACAFKVPVGGKLESMCVVNALGLRDQVYRGETPSDPSTTRPEPEPGFAGT